MTFANHPSSSTRTASDFRWAIKNRASEASHRADLLALVRSVARAGRYGVHVPESLKMHQANKKDNPFGGPSPPLGGVTIDVKLRSIYGRLLHLNGQGRSFMALACPRCDMFASCTVLDGLPLCI